MTYIFDLYKTMNKSQTLLVEIKEIQKVTQLIFELQIERGISSGYLASNGQEFKSNLHLQHEKVNTLLKELVLSKENIKLNLLHSTRKDINSLSIENKDSFIYYTRLINSIKMKYLSNIEQIEENKIRNLLIKYKYLIDIEEYLGQLRGNINAGFSQGYVDENLYNNIIYAKNIYDYSIKNFEFQIDNEMKSEYSYILVDRNYTWVFNIIEQVLKGKELDINPNTWFLKSTKVIDIFHNKEQYYIDKINIQAKENLDNKRYKLYVSIVFLFLLNVSVLYLAYKISKKISKNIKILDEYKNAVDRSSIVSKTNKKGIITYTNSSFCDISGYSYQELIGKSHNIVRHPDMPKDAFKEMWNQVLNKRAWNGIVKNRKKDGGFYWVEVTINPILDEDGNIEEFIAIRTDITDNILLHEEIEKTQEDLIVRMGEIGETRSRETGFHVRRVAKYSEILARYYGLSEKEILYLKNASPMHDIGKVGIPDYILNKPGKLNNDEWEIMKTHSEIGYDLFKNNDKPLLQAAAIIAHQHHEKYDGSGYPRGLAGDDIHIYGRISAVADVFDALGSDRVYKKAWSNEKIFSLFKEERGKHFDPALIDIFFEHLDEFLEIQRTYNGQSDYMKE